ncbi:MAG: carbon-phosphorus lyase complex subunit PhnJ [Planctomycetota bacterium]|nr:MAG: carbon-phosphorus lyase complex subunit PhnJ [Planctomycetota bacterium]
MSTHHQLPRSADYHFAFIDEDAKREIRRGLLKALAIPGHLVPYSSREMPMARGFGTGGLQITLSLVGVDDVVKVIDQGSDYSVNACAMREFIERMAPGVRTTTQTPEATLIQSRHRTPETAMVEGQIMIYQVPKPDALDIVEPNMARRRRQHAEGDYSPLYVRLYEDLVEFNEIRIANRYPLRINDRYIMDPSPIPRFDNPKLHLSPVPHLFGAGREKMLYAVPPYTEAISLAFEDIPFRVESFNDEHGARIPCAHCGSLESFLEESTNDAGKTIWRCSDTEYCERHQAQYEPSLAGGQEELS